MYELYEHETNTCPSEAKSLQRHIAYVLSNFHVDSKEVQNSLDAIRSFFFDFLGIAADEKVRKIVGVMTTSTAFRLPFETASSKGPDDTRIAMIVGKPVVGLRSGKAEMALERRYVVGVQVLNRSTVRMTSLHHAARCVVFNAKGHEENAQTLKEGRSVTPESSVCEKACAAAVAPLQETVAKGRATYDYLVEAFRKTLGIEKTSSHLLKCPSMKTPFEPLSPPRRMNTAFVESAVAGMKHKADVVEMLRPKREKRA